MKTVREWKATQIVRAEEYRATGLSYRKTADAIGESEATVRRWLRKYSGLPAVAPSPPPTTTVTSTPVAQRTRSRMAPSKSNADRVLTIKARAAAAGTALVRLQRLRPRRTVAARADLPAGADAATRAARTCNLVNALRRRGTGTVLTEDEERLLVAFAMDLDAQGLGLTREMLAEKVKLIAGNRRTPFTNGLPGTHWHARAQPDRRVLGRC
jgi:transposase-like protein